MPYFKADCNLTESSLLADHGFEGLGVWMFLLAKADSNGWVTASVPAIATAGKVTVKRVTELLESFAEPDPYSRNPAEDGRRIRIHREPEWGIEILNYHRNREKDHTAAERQQRARDRKKARELGVSVEEVRKAREKGVTLSRVTSRKTEDKGHKTGEEPTVPPNTPPPSNVAPKRKRKNRAAEDEARRAEAEKLSRPYIHVFNWCFERRCQPTSEVTRKIDAALKTGTKTHEILCIPFVHAELNSRRKDRRTIEPTWLLRDGSRDTHNWIGEALDKAGGLELNHRLTKLAEQLDMVEQLKALGVKGQ
jgi:hypothetical protein